MNRILFKEQKGDYILRSNDPRFEHVRGVLRLQVGDTFDVGVINGKAGKAEVTKINAEAFHVTVNWCEAPPALFPIILYIAYSRPQTAKKILFEASVFGVSKICFFPSSKTDPGFPKSSIWTERKWESILIQGAEQAFQTRIPELHQYETMTQAFEDASRHDKNIRKIALDLFETNGKLSDCMKNDSPLILALGPEGGWSKSDRKRMDKYGFQRLEMGNRVMRCESALISALAIIYSQRGWM